MSTDKIAVGTSDLKSINPGEYAAQPQVAPPAGYICVLRDVDSDRWRIESAPYPQRLVEGVLAEGESRLGIEIVSILKTGDLATGAATLYEVHQAQLGDTWLDLDEYQVETLRRSILQIDAHPSHYLTQVETSPAPAAVTKGSGGGRQASRRNVDRWGFRRDVSSRQPAYRLYGARSLKDYREPEPRDRRRDLDSPERWLLEKSERIGRFLNSVSGKTIQAILILLLAALLCVIDACS